MSTTQGKEKHISSWLKVIFLNKFEIILLISFFFFSTWLMNKSFSYNRKTSTYLIARNEVGDFGLHLGLIQSFAIGDNFPPQLPFFPGEPLPYHYFFDGLVGLFVKVGLPIDIAFNGLSVVALTVLLYLLYLFPQLLFQKSKLLGIFSVLLFIFPSSFTFIDFFKSNKIGLSLIPTLWKLPDYIHKGPFDGSLISIFFTLNVYLNQRHLIVSLAIALSLLYFLVKIILEEQYISWKVLGVLGIILGVLARVHSLIFLGTVITLFCIGILFQRIKQVTIIFIPALIIFSLQIHDIIFNKTSHSLIHFGFLSAQPFTLQNFLLFWLLNLGLAFFLIPLSLFLVKSVQRKVFLAILPLFILPNIFQFSYRIDHNHSLFNFFFLFANFYVAYLLLIIWKKKVWGKLLTGVLLFFLLISGVINLMPIKNDYHYPFIIQPKNQFMQWIITHTNKNSIFLEKADLLDPVVLSGRRNYYGDVYYLSVMGYKFSQRAENTKKFFEASDIQMLAKAKQDGISYMVIPMQPVADFPYIIHKEFLDQSLKQVYKDENIEVLKL